MTSDRIVSEAMVTALPPPVQRSLYRSGVVGRPLPRSVEVRQEGRIRTSADKRWLEFTARETYRVDRPGFEWKARLRAGRLALGTATDSLGDGQARMRVRLLGLLTAVDESGPEIDQGSLLRWLNETMWFPAVWAGGSITWEPVDDETAVAVVTNQSISVRAEFQFDQEGRLVDCRAQRYRRVPTGFEMTPWSTPVREHRSFDDGIEVPTSGVAVWHLDSGDLEYMQLRVTDVQHG